MPESPAFAALYRQDLEAAQLEGPSPPWLPPGAAGSRFASLPDLHTGGRRHEAEVQHAQHPRHGGVERALGWAAGPCLELGAAGSLPWCAPTSILPPAAPVCAGTPPPWPTSSPTSATETLCTCRRRSTGSARWQKWRRWAARWTRWCGGCGVRFAGRGAFPALRRCRREYRQQVLAEMAQVCVCGGGALLPLFYLVHPESNLLILGSVGRVGLQGRA